MNKVNWSAKLQHQYLSNLKILSTSMLALGIDKKFDTTRISQRKTQDILQLLQWFRKYFVTHFVKIQTYDALSRRKTLSAQKNINIQTMSTSEGQKMKKKCLTTTIINTGMNKFTKRQPQDIIKDQQLKNCFNINRQIKKIVTQQKQTAQKKLQLIKQLIISSKFQSKKSNIQNQATNTSEQIFSHNNQNLTNQSVNINNNNQNVIKIEDESQNNFKYRKLAEYHMEQEMSNQNLGANNNNLDRSFSSSCKKRN